jgi:hypothetical protein
VPHVSLARPPRHPVDCPAQGRVLSCREAAWTPTAHGRSSGRRYGTGE